MHFWEQHTTCVNETELLAMYLPINFGSSTAKHCWSFWGALWSDGNTPTNWGSHVVANVHNMARLHMGYSTLAQSQPNFDHVKYLNWCTTVHIHYLFVPVSCTSLITVLHTMPHYKIDGFCPNHFVPLWAMCVPANLPVTSGGVWSEECSLWVQEEGGHRYIYITFIAHASVTCQDYVCFIANL